MKKIFVIALLALTCVFTVTAEPFKNDYFGKFTGAASSDFYGGYDVITSQVDLSDGGKIMSWNDSSYAFVESVSCEEMLNTITTNDMARLWIALMSCFSSGTGEVQDGKVTSVCLEAEISRGVGGARRRRAEGVGIGRGLADTLGGCRPR